MNNDLSSSSSTSDPSLNSGTPNDESLLEEETAPIDSEDELQRRKRTQHDQRNIFLDHLIRITDIMVYCQLSILYYMEYAPLRINQKPPSLSISKDIQR